MLRLKTEIVGEIVDNMSFNFPHLTLEKLRTSVLKFIMELNGVDIEIEAEYKN